MVNGNVLMSRWGGADNPDDERRKRLEIIQRMFRGELTVVEAALILGVGERQRYRMKARVTKQGAMGTVHGNRGRPCKHKIDKGKDGEAVVELAKEKYRGFNHRHLPRK